MIDSYEDKFDFDYADYKDTGGKYRPEAHPESVWMDTPKITNPEDTK